MFDAKAAAEHICGHDPVLGSVIARVGPCTLAPRRGDPFTALARAVCFQQLSGKAAGTIFGRVLLAAGDGTLLDPALVLRRTDEELRAAGLSRQKIAALRDLAAHFDRRELSAHLFDEWDDEEIVVHLLRVRGIGRWTAEMYLMFELGRPDVLPVNDLGLNKAMQILYGLAALPKPPEIRALAEPWRPHATIACWYLWRSLEITLMSDPVQ